MNRHYPLLAPPLAMAAALAVAVTPATASAAPWDYTPGAPGAGDPYFPKAGNGGYDVAHYDIRLAYKPQKRRISGTAEITATATQNLSRFDLDFTGNRVRKITVNGVTASYERKGQELLITPPEGLPERTRFTVAVTYDGSPSDRDDPSLGRSGWIRTPDGAVTLSQPLGSLTWFPVNDHPSDKATHAYRITVPKGHTVIANGEPGTLRRKGGATRTYTWRTRRPMAAYLAMVAIGKFHVMDGHSPDGVRTITAVDSSLKQDRAWFHRTTGKVTDWGTRLFGPYPFTSTGGVVDNVEVPYALETQTRPVYPTRADTAVIVHELAHQWFGDSVGLKRWKDIWLNEGFATYAEWLYSEQHGGPAAQRMFDLSYATPADSPEWKTPTGAPGRQNMFDYFPVYTRGAMTLHALRTTVGDAAFFRILRTWAREHEHGFATTADFIDHAEQISGHHLRPLFRKWLYTPAKPTL